MRIGPLLLLLAVAGLAALLLVVDPLGLFSSGLERGVGDASSDSVVLEDPESVRLEGRGVEGASTTGADAAEGDLPRAEARGGAPDGASIRGRVVRARGRVPVEGARVSLLHPDILFHYLRADAAGRFDELEAVTGSDGRFAFRDVLPAAGYAVRVRATGEAVLSVEKIDLRGRPSRDLGDLVVGAAGALAGRVLDGSGRGVSGARVIATWWLFNPLQIVLTDPSTLKEVEREAATDAEGRFVLTALEPGAKTLLVLGGAKGNAVVWRAEAPEGGEAKIGDVTLAGTLPLAGTLAWSDGRPIVAARVFAGVMNDHAVQTTQTDAEGQWRLEALVPGAYVIGVLIPGLPVHLESDVQAGRTDVAIRLPAPGVVRGRVVHEASGAPVVSFGVQLVAEGQQGWRERMVQGLVDQALGPLPFGAGRFELAMVAPGTYRARVNAGGHPLATGEPFTVESGTVAEVTVTLKAGVGAEGVVRDARGDPLGSVRLYVMPPDPDVPPWTARSLAGWAEDREVAAVSGPDGTFVLPPQTPGTYHVVALHDDHLPTMREGVDLSGQPPRLDLTLKASGGLEGLATGDGGAPAGGIEVAVLYPDGELYELETDEEGRFARTNLPPGRFLLLWYRMLLHPAILNVTNAADPAAREEAYEALRDQGREHELVEGRTLEVTLRIPRRVRVHGTLRVDGRPATARQGVWVAIPTMDRGSFVRCDERGAFEFLLAPGSYRLWAPDKDGAWSPTEISVPDTDEMRVELER